MLARGYLLSTRKVLNTGHKSQGVLQNMYEPLLMEKSDSMRIWFIPHVHVTGIPIKSEAIGMLTLCDCYIISLFLPLPI